MKMPSGSGVLKGQTAFTPKMWAGGFKPTGAPTSMGPFMGKNPGISGKPKMMKNSIKG